MATVAGVQDSTGFAAAFSVRDPGQIGRSDDAKDARDHRTGRRVRDPKEHGRHCEDSKPEAREPEAKRECAASRRVAADAARRVVVVVEASLVALPVRIAMPSVHVIGLPGPGGRHTVHGTKSSM
jgi:hypothetical protein